MTEYIKVNKDNLIKTIFQIGTLVIIVWMAFAFLMTGMKLSSIITETDIGAGGIMTMLSAILFIMLFILAIIFQILIEISWRNE